ncbi:MAG: hypothetical protein R3E14_03525 [Erythrobacter sp.]
MQQNVGAKQRSLHFTRHRQGRHACHPQEVMPRRALACGEIPVEVLWRNWSFDGDKDGALDHSVQRVLK